MIHRRRFLCVCMCVSDRDTESLASRSQCLYLWLHCFAYVIPFLYPFLLTAACSSSFFYRQRFLRTVREFSHLTRWDTVSPAINKSWRLFNDSEEKKMIEIMFCAYKMWINNVFFSSFSSCWVRCVHFLEYGCFLVSFSSAEYVTLKHRLWVWYILFDSSKNGNYDFLGDQMNFWEH